MRKLSSRTAGFTDSVIRRMTRVSLQYGAVNLSQGFPDFDPPRELTDRLAKWLRRAPINMPSPGCGQFPQGPGGKTVPSHGHDH